MSLYQQYDILDTPVSCFSSTLEGAQEAATQKCTELRNAGHIAAVAEQGHQVRDGLYAWNVYAKRRRYK